MQYRPARVAGGTHFFTVNLLDRSADTLVRHFDELRAVIAKVKAAHPLSIVALVVLPEHLHTIWRLPAGDAGYPLRGSLIKAGFSRGLATGERIRHSRAAKRERDVWQRRYWEHQIRDEADPARHVDYIHCTPVRHKWVAHPADWPYATQHGYIARGVVPRDWGGCAEDGEHRDRFGER